MQNWDDLKLFLAAARAGNSRAGAEALGINQSTVSRRITQLEHRSGVRLFDRGPGGLTLTEAGAELVELAEEVEASIDTVDRRLEGRDLELVGTVRLSMPDFLVRAVAPHLARFGADYPQIAIDVLVSNGLVDLSQREAELALRLADNPPPQLVGRRIARTRMAVYGSAAYVADAPSPVAVEHLHWIRWTERWRGSAVERWIDEHVAAERVRARVDTSVAHTEMIAAGVGVGFLPCFGGDADDRLVRIGERQDFGLSLWLLTHADLKRTARVRTLLRFLSDALSLERSRFVGAPPTG